MSFPSLLLSLLLSLKPRAGRRPPAHRHPAPHRRPFVPRLEALEDRTVPSTLTVLNNLDSGAGSLRDTIAAAQSGETIAFDPSLAGQTINLTSGELVINKSLDIEGPGDTFGNPTLSILQTGTGNRVFDVTNPTSTVTLAHLFISRSVFAGPPVGQGGAIFDAAATLNLSHDFIGGSIAGADATASTSAGDGQGGAIYQAGGALNLTWCSVVGGAAGGNGGTFGPGGAGQGGAIYNAGGVLNVAQCEFLGFASGGGGTAGGTAAGGAIYDAGGTTAISGNVFVSGRVGAGFSANGGPAGSGFG